MAGNTYISVLVFCTSFLIVPSLHECRSLPGYKFTVYTTELCPRNQAEWKERSSILNCSESSYMCLPNEHFTQLLEFCYITNRIHITPSTCMYLHGKMSVLDGYNCLKFTHGCPNSSYFSNETYKFQSCLSIGKGYFLAEQSCYSNSSLIANANETTKEKRYQRYTMPSEKQRDVVWIVVVTLLCVLLAICTIYHWIKKPYIRLPCKLKFNGNNNSNISHNQEENATFLAEANKRNDVLNTTDASLQTNTTDASLQTNVTDNSCYTDNIKVSRKDTSDTSTLTDSGICDYDGLSPLHIACARGHHSTVCYLIENGADINSRDHNGKSLLYLTCEYGHVEIIELLLSKGADVNIYDEDGASPLYIACQQGDDDIVKLLIKNGAVVNDKTYNLKFKKMELN